MDIDLGNEGVTRDPMNGYPTLPGEMIMNLADNVLCYPPRGARVTLAVHQVDTIYLTVDDNGPGILQAQRKAVFERFVQLQESPAEGYGLGLVIVQEIAASHGARVVQRKVLGK